ncbi:MAG: hypothetical protein JKY86_15475 [Gammaproteobacteria bacterium]|nr:hypothetical protein [Gammaproteobacteria bacterium]
MTNNITNEQIINAIDNKWTKELRAMADGKEIQFLLSESTLVWAGCSEPGFREDTKYRVKPVEKTIDTYLLKADDGHYYNATEETMRVQTNTFEAEIVETYTFTYTEEE